MLSIRLGSRYVIVIIDRYASSIVTDRYSGCCRNIDIEILVRFRFIITVDTKCHILIRRSCRNRYGLLWLHNPNQRLSLFRFVSNMLPLPVPFAVIAVIDIRNVAVVVPVLPSVTVVSLILIVRLSSSIIVPRSYRIIKRHIRRRSGKGYIKGFIRNFRNQISF